MTEANTVRTFGPRLESIFDKAGIDPTYIPHDEHPGTAMPADLFDQMIVKNSIDIETIEHQRVTRPEGKADIVVMMEGAFCDLMNCAHRIIPTHCADIAAAFDI